MGDTTTNRGYRKPLSTDDPVNLTSFWRNMADDIDADVALVLTERGVPVAPTTQSSNGTATSGTTETRDSVLGNYVFTALAGVRYRAVVEGMNVLCTAAGDRFACNIRTGGGSTPTASSTLWGVNTTFWVPANTSTFGLAVSASFIPGAGTQTLGVFLQRLSTPVGTGTATPTGARQFYVEAIGTV